MEAALVLERCDFLLTAAIAADYPSPAVNIYSQLDGFTRSLFGSNGPIYKITLVKDWGSSFHESGSSSPDTSAE
jgi:hypothetical protein